MLRTSLQFSFALFLALSLSSCDSVSPEALDLDGGSDARLDSRASVERQTSPGVSCPCFNARDLAAPVGGATKEPYLFFDTFNWWGLDYRRTELRSFADVKGTIVEEVASVYITPGDPGSHFTLICYRQDVRPDPYGDGFNYHYTTIEPDLDEAEACRRTIYAAAAASELACQGPACGFPYEKSQLYPDYPAYEDDRAQLRLHTELTRTIESVRSTLQISR